MYQEEIDSKNKANAVGNAIEAQNLTKTYVSKSKQVEALKNVSFKVPKGKITLLVGPDGAGKTSFLKMCVGISAPTSGSLKVLDLEVIKHSQEIQNRICYMSQKFGLYEDLSIEENLRLYADINGLSPKVREQRMIELMEKADLLKFRSRLAGNLSGGMKQKLALICSMLNRPELLILDEPCVGVDPLSRRDLWKIIISANKELGATVVVSTAYIDEIEYADYVYLFNQGLVFHGSTAQELKNEAKDQCFAIAKGQLSARLIQGNLIEKTDYIIDAVPRRGKISFTLKSADKFPDFLNSLNPVLQQPEAEDGFMAVFCRVTGMSHHFVHHLPDVLTVKELESKNVTNSDVQLATTSSSSNSNLNSISSSTQKVSNSPNVVLTNKNQDQVPIIEVRDLYRTFGSFIAVNRTSFKVFPGEIFGLLGPNGAGKTTTFRMLCGLLPASGGFLQVADHNLLVDGAYARKNIGYVAQKFSLYGDLTVAQNLNFFGRVYGMHGSYFRKRYAEVIDEFQLQDILEEKSGDLPFGFKQRLSMAVGTIHEPKILFLDEPTSGIDPFARRVFWHQITDLSSRGTTIIITTHFLEEAEYCDRMMIQDAGKMIAYGTPDEVRIQGGATKDYEPSMDEVFLNIVMKAREVNNG